jgi:uncharacterized iron-regulated membrane protein
MRAPAALLLLVAACSHTETVKKPAAGEGAQASAAQGRRAPSGSRASVPRSDNGTPVPREPEKVLAPGQLERVQGQLASRGLLEAHQRGTLDEPTRRALRRLQHDSNLPETGLPDHETVRKLGLDPDKVFDKR